METPTPGKRIIMRNIPCLSRTPGSATPIVRSLPKEVFLYDWWLVRAAAVSNGSHLLVAGFTSRGRQVMEIFHSAPIVKRHGTVTLESVDGITISISGFINRSRTLENGFSKEVCDKFLLGFPYNWEEFATAPDGISPHMVNPQLSETRSSLKYTLPVAFEDLPAVAIQDLLMSIPEYSESSMTNIVVENIRKSYAGSDCTGGKMTDCIKAPCSSYTGGKMADCIKAPCTGGKMPDCLKADASQEMDSTRGNQTWNIANAVKHGHTVIHVVPETTSSVERRIEILQNPEDVITTSGAVVGENMNSAFEKPLECCVDSHASIITPGAGVRENMNTASENASIITPGAGVRENMNTASEKPLEGCVDSHASIITPGAGVRDNMNTTSEKPLEGFVDPQASIITPGAGIRENMNTASQKPLEGCGDSHASITTAGAGVRENMNTTSEKCLEGSCLNSHARGRPPPNNMSSTRVTRSMKRQRISSLQNTSATTDGLAMTYVLDTPKKPSHIPVARCLVPRTSEPSKPQNTPKKPSHIPVARCLVPRTREPSKPQNDSEKVEESQKRSTLRRSSRLQNRKQHANVP